MTCVTTTRQLDSKITNFRQSNLTNQKNQNKTKTRPAWHMARISPILTVSLTESLINWLSINQLQNIDQRSDGGQE